MFKKEFYILKVWFSTILFTPLFLFLFWVIILRKDKKEIFDAFDIYWLFVVLGLFFSIPTIVIFGYLYRYLSKRNLKMLEIKTYLCMFSIFGVFTTFYLLEKSFVSSNINQLLFPISYSVIMSFSIFLISKGKISTSSTKS